MWRKIRAKLCVKLDGLGCRDKLELVGPYGVLEAKEPTGEIYPSNPETEPFVLDARNLHEKVNQGPVPQAPPLLRSASASDNQEQAPINKQRVEPRDSGDPEGRTTASYTT